MSYTPSAAGKGDQPRKVDKKRFDRNWEKIDWNDDNLLETDYKEQDDGDGGRDKRGLRKEQAGDNERSP